MSNDISISDSNILSFQMSSGDHRGIIPLTAVKKEPQNQGGKDHKFARSEEAQIPSDIVDVYASLDNQEEAKPKSTSTEKPPTIIQLSNLHNRGINFIAANSSSIYAITSSHELVVSPTNLEEERTSKAEFISPNSLDLYTCFHVSCGMDHAIVLAMNQDDKNPVVLSRGSNQFGQCGLGAIDYQTNFKPIQFPNHRTPRVVQSECGTNFTLLLTDTCDVWAFGHNHRGQLGLGPDSQEIVRSPTLVQSLQGLPILSIAAGLGHSLALTSTGLVYAAGRNDLGQLGTVSSQSTNEFVPVDTLANVFIVHIAACHNYSAAIDEFGTVYLWGDQWGLTPKTLSLGQTDQFVDIAVGNDGRFAALSSTNGLYIYGYYLANGDQMQKVVRLEYPQQPYFRVFTAGDYFLVLAGPNTPPLMSTSMQGATLSLLPPERTLVKDKLRAPAKVMLLKNNHFPRFVVFPWAKEIIRAIFSSLGAINGSFMLERYSESQSSEKSGVDLDLVCSAYEQFSNGVSIELLHQLNESFTQTLNKVMESPPKLYRRENLRFLITALLHPSISQVPGPDSYDFWMALIAVIRKLRGATEILKQWLSDFPAKYLKRVVSSLNDFLNTTTQHTGIYGKSARDTVEVIEIVWLSSTRSQALQFTDFYNEELCKRIEVNKEYCSYESPNDDWCYMKQAPYILTAAIKTAFVRERSIRIMSKYYIDACARCTVYQGGRPCVNPEDWRLILKVKRSNILSSCIEAIENIKNPKEAMRRQLMIVFDGEPGVDEGGVQREFFQLVVQKLLSPDLATFIQTRDFYWFNKDIDDGLLEHVRIAGIIFGLAVYNGNLLNIRFPLALYKKIKGMSVNINDLEEFDPQLASTLQNILTYTGDVENDMCLTYEFLDHELVKGGKNIPVTKYNRKDYVDKVVDYVLNDSVAKPFNAFKEGFLSAAINLTLSIFRPEELMLLVAGEEELDFNALEANTRYDGYEKDSPTVKTFWNIVRNRLTLEEKKKLLYFVTSSPRAPIGGLGKVPFVIAKDGTKNHIPTSHTCFYMLVLPDDPDEESLLKKLRIAIENSQGFQFK